MREGNVVLNRFSGYLMQVFSMHVVQSSPRKVKLEKLLFYEIKIREVHFRSPLIYSTQGLINAGHNDRD